MKYYRQDVSGSVGYHGEYLRRTSIYEKDAVSKTLSLSVLPKPMVVYGSLGHIGRGPAPCYSETIIVINDLSEPWVQICIYSHFFQDNESNSTYGQSSPILCVFISSEKYRANAFLSE